MAAIGQYAANRIAWDLKDNRRICVELTVPFGCTALVTLPGSDRVPFEISAGSYKYEYMPVRDYRRIFQPDCLLGQVFNHPGAKETLLTMVPQAAAWDTEEGSEKQISDLFELAMFGANPVDVSAAIEALRQLEAW